MSTGTWPPPVTFPEGPPPAHPPPGAGATSQGVKSASPTTSSPVPPMLFTLVGPVFEPHQLHLAFTVPTWLLGSTSSPSRTKFAEPTTPMLFSLITTPELGPPTAPKKLMRIAWAVPVVRLLFMMLRSVLLSRMRRVALTGLSAAVVLLVTLLSWNDDMCVLKRIKARPFRLNEFVEISRLKAP